MHVFDIIALLIFCSALFIFVNTVYLKLPSSIGLMIMALILSLAVYGLGVAFPNLNLAHQISEFNYQEVLYRFVLSIMLFAGALNVDFKKLGDQLIPVLLLSTIGVIISTLLIASSVYLLLNALSIELHFIACLAFGALISSTDPVAISKTMKKLHISDKLEVKVSSEAHLNGAIAIILALFFVHLYQETGNGVYWTLPEAVWIFSRELFGGVFLGLFIGWLSFHLLRFVDNDHVEIEVLITLAVVMGGSFLAELIAVSPIVVATLTGLIIGNYGRDTDGEHAVGSYVYKFWNLMEESFAAMLFVLIGFEMIIIPLRLDYFAVGFFTVIIALFARWVSVYIPIKLMARKRDFEEGTVSILSWGALRGGLPVAVTLSLTNFPGKEIIITLTYIVVVCTVLYQGLTLKSMLSNYIKSATPMKENYDLATGS